jgi:hypothetical protein
MPVSLKGYVVGLLKLQPYPLNDILNGLPNLNPKTAFGGSVRANDINTFPIISNGEYSATVSPRSPFVMPEYHK